MEPHWRTIQAMGPDTDAVEGLRFFRSRAPDPDEIVSQLLEIAARLKLAMGSLRDALGDIPELGFGKTPQAEGRGDDVARKGRRSGMPDRTGEEDGKAELCTPPVTLRAPPAPELGRENVSSISRLRRRRSPPEPGREKKE